MTSASQDILVEAGDDVILPCHIEPSYSADKTTVEWSRPDLEPKYVHIRQQGREVPHFRLNPQYRKRTSLFAPELPRGNVSLKLPKVQLSDEGTFRCYVPNLDSSTLVHLQVGKV